MLPTTPSVSLPSPICFRLTQHFSPFSSPAPEHPLLFLGFGSFAVCIAMNSSHTERWLPFCPHAHRITYILPSEDVTILFEARQGHQLLFCHIQKDKAKVRGVAGRSEGPIIRSWYNRVTPTQRDPHPASEGPCAQALWEQRADGTGKFLMALALTPQEITHIDLPKLTMPICCLRQALSRTRVLCCSPGQKTQEAFFLSKYLPMPYPPRKATVFFFFFCQGPSTAF